jgi:hypothetical protein
MSDGSRHSLAFVAEAIPGTTPATPTLTPVRAESCSIGLTKDLIEPTEIRSDRHRTSVRHGAKKVGGETAINVSYGSHDSIFQAAFCGTWEADEPATGTDQLKIGVTRRTHTFERYYEDILDKPYHRFTRVELDKLSLQISSNAVVTGKFSVVGGDHITAATAITSSSYSTESTTDVFTSMSGVVKEGGNTNAYISELSIELDNGMEALYAVGNPVSFRSSIKRAKVTGSATVYFEDNVMYEKFVNETESSLEVNLADAAGNALKILLPRVKYSSGSPDVKGEGPISLTMKFDALADDTYDSEIVMERTPT